MAKYFEKTCPKCKQRLRIPKSVGGVTMVCPSCGNKMASDFKLGRSRSQETAGISHMLISLFEFPGRLVDNFMKKIFPR